jgi:IPT/TIG domain
MREESTRGMGSSTGRGLLPRPVVTRFAVLAVALVGALGVAGSAVGVTITSFTPTSGLPNKDNGTACPGATVTISGSGFVNDGPASAVQVLFNGLAAAPGSVQIGSDSTLYAIVPDGASDGPITVVTAAGRVTSTAKFYVNPCPQVSLAAATSGTSVVGVPSTPSLYGVKPTSGKVGAKVTITGTSFLGVTGVTFNGVKAKFKVDSPTRITTSVPKGAKTGKIGIVYSITGSVSKGGVTPDASNKGPGAETAVNLSRKSFKVLA